MQASSSRATAADDEFDVLPLLKWFGAIPLQTGIMTGALFGLQQASQALAASESLPEGFDAPKYLFTAFFLLISIRSRIFSPLPAPRPTVAGTRTELESEQRPPWTPPAIAFPIVWSLIGLLRAGSSVLVWEASGRDALAFPLIVMCAHLAVGDCWNSVKNAEKRLGVATTGMLFTTTSAYAVVAAYYAALPTAGELLAPSAVWITVAATIVWGTWDLSGRPPLYPTKGESRRAAELAAERAATKS